MRNFLLLNTEMLDIAYVNNVGIIAKNPKMTAINSALEVGEYFYTNFSHRFLFCTVELEVTKY